MAKFNFLRRFVRRSSAPTVSVAPNQPTKKRSTTSHRFSKFSLSKHFRLSSSVSRISRFFSGLRKKSTTIDDVTPSTSPPEVRKKSWWMFTKKTSCQNTKNKNQLEEVTGDEVTKDKWTEVVDPFFIVDSADSNFTMINEPELITCPEYTATGSIHSYVSSSDDECGARTIVLPVLSVMQSITDIHNTCILELVPDHCTKKEESQALIMKTDTESFSERKESQELINLETGTENLSVTIKQIVTGNPAVKEEDKWTDEGEKEVTNDPAARDLATFLAASFITAILLVTLMLLLL